MKNIVIIGAGLSGYLVAINLLRHHNDGLLQIDLIDRYGTERLGLAYSTTDNNHLLNVPAGKMSAFLDQPGHFMNWLNLHYSLYSELSFVPRNIYRLYILDLFDQYMSSRKLTVNILMTTAEVVDINMMNKTVQTKEGVSFPFHQLILATGTFASGHLSLSDRDYITTKNYYPSPWNQPWGKKIRGNERIVIIGSGLTMADTLLSLSKTSHAGPITAISRHGLLPAVHQRHEPYPHFMQDLHTVDTSLGMFQVIRFHLRKAKASGYDWRAVIDALRPYTSVMWQQLHDLEKSKFLEHLRHFWETCRHRMPESCGVKIFELVSSKRLDIAAGRISNIHVLDEGGYKITLLKRGATITEDIFADVIINCISPATNYNATQEPLFQNLIRQKLACTDTLCLGLSCDDDGGIIGRNGMVSDCMHTIGAPKKGKSWETTAVPEIRVQAFELAHKILKLVNDVKITRE